MDAAVSRRALEALAGEHGLPILRFLRSREWTLASQVAEALGVHTTTASKYLAAFHEVGFLDRRAHAAKRPTFAYRLRSPVIRFEFDLGPRTDVADAKRVATAFTEALLSGTARVGGTRLTGALVRGLFGAEDWRGSLEGRFGEAGDAVIALDLLIETARRATADLVGSATAARLVKTALSAASEGHADIVSALRLTEVRP